MKSGYVDKYRIIAIDPSTNATGIVVLEVDLNTKKLHVAFSTTFKRRDLLRGHKWMAEVYGERETAVYCYGEMLKELLRTWEPSAVIIESPFLSRLPQAFKALTEILTTFRNIVVAWDVTVPFEVVDPPTVKKGIGVNGGSKDKVDMYNALKGTTLPITYAQGLSLEDMEDHEWDAIAIALYYYNTFLQPHMV
mgnify:CR=1 FL=1